MFLRDERQPEVDLLHSSAVNLNNEFEIVRVRTLCHTNLVASSHIEREKSSLPLDVHRSKTSLLILPNNWRVSFD